MPTLQLQRYDQILDRMISRVVARTQLTDVSDSSVMKHLLSAFARETDEIYFQFTRLQDITDLDTASGDDLDEKAKEVQPQTIKRLGARQSVGNVIFSRVATVGDVSIPTGTVVKTGDGVVFKTTLQSVILAGNTDSALVPITAEEAGLSGDVDPGTILKFGSKPPGIDSVTNPAATTQGRDLESDISFRDRIRAFILSLARSTVDALEFAALEVEDPLSGKVVIFSHVFEDPVTPSLSILYIDDGAGTSESVAVVVGENLTEGLLGPPLDSAVGGEEFLFANNKPIKLETLPSVSSSTRGVLGLGVEYFLNPASGRFFFDPPLAAAEVITIGYTYFDGLIAEVQKVIDGDPNDRENFPGFRAAGTIVRVLAPVVVNVSVEAVLTLTEGTDRPTAVASAEAAITEYINTLGISGDVIRNELIERLMGVDGVVDLSLVTPTSNINILDNEIARITLASINIT